MNESAVNIRAAYKHLLLTLQNLGLDPVQVEQDKFWDICGSVKGLRLLAPFEKQAINDTIKNKVTELLSEKD